MRAPCLGAALLALAVPAVCHAQLLPLTESEALARLSAESPRVLALRSGVDVARAEALSAGRWPNPRVTFNRESAASVSENIFTVGQMLPLSGRRGLDVKSAGAMVDAAAARVEDAVRRARTDLRLAFARLLAAQTRQGQLVESHRKLAEIVQVLERREIAGDVAGYDRIRAARELFDLEAEQALAQGERSRVQGSLAGFFQDVDPTALVAVGASVSRVEVPPLALLLERAESSRGELQGLRHEATAAQFSSAAAERRRIPEPEVFGGTKSSTAGAGDVGGVIGVQLTVPLFDRSGPERALSEAREHQALARARAFQQSLRAEAAALRETVTLRRAAADRYRDSAVRDSEQIERIARVSYEAGERSVLELLDAYRAGIAAGTRQAALDLAVREAEIELEFVTGWEMP